MCLPKPDLAAVPACYHAAMTSIPTENHPVSFGHAGRVCLITGAAQGIGAACVRRFAAEGAHVVLADVDDARGAALAAELSGLYVHCDVGDKAQVDQLVRQALDWQGRIDVLVNNAGIFRAADFLDVTEEDFDAVLRVNVKGSFLVGQAVARTMAQAGRGSVVNMTADFRNGMPGMGHSGAARAGMANLTKTAAVEWAASGVRVNAISPGAIRTPATNNRVRRCSCVGKSSANKREAIGGVVCQSALNNCANA